MTLNLRLDDCMLLTGIGNDPCWNRAKRKELLPMPADFGILRVISTTAVFNFPFLNRRKEFGVPLNDSHRVWNTCLPANSISSHPWVAI